ncbi:MAG: hypothetical protein ABIQ32_09265 [Sphingomicrobium sp.]
MLRAILFLGFFLISFAYSMWRGGAPERLAAMLLLAALIGSTSAGVFRLPGGFTSVPIALALVDLLLGIALVALAVRANRLWPIPLAACQLITVLAHAAKLAAPQMFAGGYALLIAISAWPIMGILMFGAYCHRRRIKAGHRDRPWKHSSRAMEPTARS